MAPISARLRVSTIMTALVLVLAASAVLTVVRRAPGPGDDGRVSAERLDVYGRVPPFTLTERSGRPFGLGDVRGHVWAVTFMYTRCTDACPLLSQDLARIQREFADAPDLRLVSITVDPEHDTPAVLREYAARYGAGDRWFFLTGPPRDVYCLATTGFRLPIEAGDAKPIDCGPATTRLGPGVAWAHEGDDHDDHAIVHSDRIVLVDGSGRIRAYHSSSDPKSMAALRANLRRLLAERH